MAASTASPGPPVNWGARDSARGATSPVPLPSSSLATTAPPVRLLGPDSWQLLFDGQDPAAALALSENLIDFGACSRLAAAEPRSITITNKTAAKLMVFACVPAWQDPSAPRGVSAVMGAAASPQFPGQQLRSLSGRGLQQSMSGQVRGEQQQPGVFKVFPESLDLRPGASGVVKVVFRPPKDGQHYCCAIQVGQVPRGCLSCKKSTSSCMA